MRTPDGKSRHKLAGVMGWPIEHSLSPRLHGYWLRHYKIEGEYKALAVPSGKLAASLRALPAQNYRGVNLTLPHKQAALRIVDFIDPLARRIGAVNLVIVREDGKLEGRNTDAYGFTQNLRASGYGASDRPAVVLGAGGAARAVLAALIDMGLGRIHLLNRTQNRAHALAEELGREIRVFPWTESAQAFQGAGLLVNATSLGMQGEPPLEIPLDALPKEAAVADLVYAPLETNLLRRASARGHKTVDGLGMLLYQAQPAFEVFFGKKPDVTPELRAFLTEGR